MTICSMITSFIYLEIINHDEMNALMKKTLNIEIVVLLFFYIELFLCYFIRPKFKQTTEFLMLMSCFSLIPISLFLFLWVYETFKKNNQ